MSLANFIREQARELGFEAVGFTDARDLDQTEEVVLQRIDAGLMAGLNWFTPARARLACKPQALLPGARSVISLAASYNVQTTAPAPHSGRIARYAWGKDYHEVLRRRCHALVAAITRELGYRPDVRVFVDSSPFVDRAVAQKAGVGWYGKNTNILIHGLGSWAFLAAIVLDVDLPEEAPLLTNCGACDLCIRACPTGALIDQYTLDNQRCISFHTIENRGSIPAEMRPLMGDWVFGCDVCQDVCPVNRKASKTPIEEFQSADGSVPLSELLAMDTATYQDRFRGRAVKRAKQRDLQRNAAVALGNTGDRGMVGILNKGMESAESIVRSHTAWAMGRLGGKAAQRGLEASRHKEQDPEVLHEIEGALSHT